MTLAAGRLERVAQIVAGKAAEMLGARVWAVDVHSRLLADSNPPGADTPSLSAADLQHLVCLRIPVHLGTQTGQVLMSQPAGGENISPRLAQAVVDLIVQQATVVESLPNQHELKNKFISDLLHGTADDEGSLLRQAQILGMDLAPPRAVILIDASSYILSAGAGDEKPSEAQVRRRQQLLISSVVGFFMLPNDTICAYIGNGEVAVLKASNTQNLSAWVDQSDGEDHSSGSWANLHALKRAASALLARLRADTRCTISIGVGRYHPGLGGLAKSYEDAGAALSLGRRFQGPNQVHCLDSLGIPAFVGVADERTKVDLATHLLSPLDSWPELLETLEVYFAEDCCASSTAARLSIHRNTLAYRLNKVHLLAGFDPRHFDDAVQIRLALALRALHSPST